MKATELRLGNIIQYDTSSYWNKGLAGTTQEVTLEIMEELFNPEVSPHYVGIPLTEEWLLKFGFKNGGVFPDNEYFLIHKDQAEFEEWGLYFKDEFTCEFIKYVHQLQNLYFALTGTPLNITP